jgi:transposase-like protein
MEVEFMTRMLATLRCDHCRGKLGLAIRRYWHMRFCCSTCVAAYQRRLGEQTKVKIGHLDFIPPDIRTVGSRFLDSVARNLPG